MGLVQALPALPEASIRTAWCVAVAFAAVWVAVVMIGARWRVPRTIRPWLRPWLRPFAIAWLAWTVLAALLGAGWAVSRADGRLAERLPAAMAGRILTLTGRIGSLPQRTEGQGGVEGWRFVLDVDERELTTPPRVLLSCYQMPTPPRAGERWSLPVKLRPPHGLMNPGGFDTALWMLEQDLPAAGTCRAQGQRRLDAGGGGLAMRVLALRQALRDAIDRQLGEVRDRRGAGVLAALSLGDQGAVQASDWALYRDTGVAHLLSVSGLHVTMFAWLAGAIGAWAWRRSARLCLAVPAPRAAMWIGVLAATFYAVFSGWGVPAQRTVGLLALLALLRQLGARWPWPMSLLAAALGVCVADPWALTQAGFWLSFGAVALLMAADHRAEPGWRGALRVAWRTQWLVTLGLAPLTLLLFQQLAVVGLVANAAAIPLVSYVITPLAMLGAICPPLWQLGAWLVTALNAGLELLRTWSFAVWHLPWAPGWAQGLGLAGGVALAMPWSWRPRLAGLALCVPLFWPALDRPALGHFELWLPDVGQGGAAVLRTHGHTMAFDAGPRWGPGSDAAQRVVLPLLRGLGEHRLDALMVSHADQDHAGGTASLLQALPVTWRLGAVPGGEACRRGQRWEWDGVRFEVLWPKDAIQAAGAGAKRNAASCVLRVEAAGRRVLLTGDIEAAQEAWLTREEGVDGLRAEVLVVPHHGSRTSSSWSFVQAVGPRVAAVQSGFLNRFGHPRAEVLARYAAIGATVVNTADCGAWRWRSDRSGPPMRDCERALRRRYWLTPPIALGEPSETALPDEDPDPAPFRP